MEKKRILIVEDDSDIRELVRQSVSKEGWKAVEAETGRQALDLVKKQRPDMVILDLMLPELEGKEICKVIKGDRDTKTIPVVILTAKGDEVDRIIGFELGADDYLSKPFSPRELILRMKAIFNRLDQRPETAENSIVAEHLEVLLEKRIVRYRGKPVDLTKVEFDLLKTLLRRPGIVFSRDDLMDIVLGIDASIESRTMDMHVSRLREKLASFGKFIETVRGVGYRLSDEVKTKMLG